MGIYGHNFLYTTYADDNSFFFKNKKFVIKAFKILAEFSSFLFGLKTSKEKCEVVGIGVKKGEKIALCGIKNVYLEKNTVKILGAHYSYNEKLENEKNFKNHIQKKEAVLKIWRMRNLILEGKITIFKKLEISKIKHLASVTVLRKSTITQLNKIHKEFI